jgi:hypothetical protein
MKRQQGFAVAARVKEGEDDVIVPNEVPLIC